MYVTVLNVTLFSITVGSSTNALTMGSITDIQTTFRDFGMTSMTVTTATTFMKLSLFVITTMANVKHKTGFNTYNIDGGYDFGDQHDLIIITLAG